MAELYKQLTKLETFYGYHVSRVAEELKLIHQRQRQEILQSNQRLSVIVPPASEGHSQTTAASDQAEDGYHGLHLPPPTQARQSRNVVPDSVTSQQEKVRDPSVVETKSNTEELVEGAASMIKQEENAAVQEQKKRATDQSFGRQIEQRQQEEGSDYEKDHTEGQALNTSAYKSAKRVIKKDFKKIRNLWEERSAGAKGVPPSPSSSNQGGARARRPTDLAVPPKPVYNQMPIWIPPPIPAVIPITPSTNTRSVSSQAMSQNIFQPIHIEIEQTDFFNRGTERKSQSTDLVSQIRAPPLDDDDSTSIVSSPAKLGGTAVTPTNTNPASTQHAIGTPKQFYMKDEE